jgi:site-specific DNA-methyltransferase (adenine-specific)
MLEINKIYNTNFKEGLKLIANNSIDLVVTDPPYKTITGGDSDGANSERPKGMLGGNRKLFKHQNNIKISDWIPELYRVLKEGTHCYIFTNVLNLNEMLNESQKAGFKLHNLLVWEKNNCTPSQFYMKNCEYVLFLRKGKAKWVNNIGGSKTVHKFNNIIGKKLHPTEKPVELLKYYILNSSNTNDLVFDPFIGSGSLAQACIEADRNFLGFEIDEEYYNIATNRINKII